MSAEHCIRCGRFVGDEAVEVQSPGMANASDPDGFTGTFICAYDRGCNVIAASDWCDRYPSDSRTFG